MEPRKAQNNKLSRESDHILISKPVKFHELTSIWGTWPHGWPPPTDPPCFNGGLHPPFFNSPDLESRRNTAHMYAHMHVLA